MTPDEIQQFHAARKEAGLKIDPQTAEINVGYGQILDPYGLEENLPPEAQCIGRLYFARFPGSDEWVEFGDLPKATRDALVDKHRHKWTFPGGLSPRLPEMIRPLLREIAELIAGDARETVSDRSTGRVSS